MPCSASVINGLLIEIIQLLIAFLSQTQSDPGHHGFAYRWSAPLESCSCSLGDPTSLVKCCVNCCVLLTCRLRNHDPPCPVQLIAHIIFFAARSSALRCSIYSLISCFLRRSKAICMALRSLYLPMARVVEGDLKRFKDYIETRDP